MERLINSDSMVTQLWHPITLRNPEDRGGMFSETSVSTRDTGTKSKKASIIDTTVKASQTASVV
jgi:hypothetical protein